MRGTALIVITVGVITGHWSFATDHGLVQRADIIAIYEESGSDQGAADKGDQPVTEGRAALRRRRCVDELADG